MKNGIERLGAILLTVMFLVTLFQVVARVILGISSVWSEELARFLYVCIVFIGAIPLVKDDGHIRVGILTDHLSGRPAACLKVIIAALTLPFLAVMTQGAWTNTRLNWTTSAPTLDWLRIGYIYLVIFVAGLFMLWYLIVQIVRNVRLVAGASVVSGGSRP
jgi:TRAP-type transport system small permease protein